MNYKPLYKGEKTIKETIKGIFVILFVVLIPLFILQGAMNHTHVSYQFVNEQFNNFEKRVEDFLDKPEESKVNIIFKGEDKFLWSYDELMKHQTLFNKVFRIEPILTKEQLIKIEQKRDRLEALKHQFIDTAFLKFYNATDFLPLLKEVEENGSFSTEDLLIIKEGNNRYTINFNGRIEDSNFSQYSLIRKYFIIKTDSANFYWQKPEPPWRFNRKGNDVVIQVESSFISTKYIFKKSID